MVPPGTQYAIILHDSKLRKACVGEPERPRSAGAATARYRFSFRLFERLRAALSEGRLAVAPASPAHKC